MTLTEATPGREYRIACVSTEDEEMKSFLFSLGCYRGEPVVVISKRKQRIVVSIKEGRYSLDSLLANVIEVEG